MSLGKRSTRQVLSADQYFRRYAEYVPYSNLKQTKKAIKLPFKTRDKKIHEFLASSHKR